MEPKRCLRVKRDFTVPKKHNHVTLGGMIKSILLYLYIRMSSVISQKDFYLKEVHTIKYFTNVCNLVGTFYGNLNYFFGTTRLCFIEAG